MTDLFFKNCLRIFVRRFPIVLIVLMLTNMPGYANRHRSKAVKAKYIDSLMTFSPVSSIYVISEGNAMEFDDSVSRLSAVRLDEVVQLHADKMKLRRKFTTDDSNLRQRAMEEIVFLFKLASKKVFLEDTQGVPVLDSINRAGGMRYVLLTLNEGFIRTKENYRTQNKKAIGPAIATLGMYMRTPIPAASFMQVMILDMEAHKTYYFADFMDHAGIHATFKSNPLNREALDKQFMTLFNYFFWLLPS